MSDNVAFIFYSGVVVAKAGKKGVKVCSRVCPYYKDVDVSFIHMWSFVLSAQDVFKVRHKCVG